jgi:hypothetical protein
VRQIIVGSTRPVRSGKPTTGADASPLLDLARRIGSAGERVAWRRAKSSNRAKHRRGLATLVLPLCFTNGAVLGPAIAGFAVPYAFAVSAGFAVLATTIRPRGTW